MLRWREREREREMSCVSLQPISIKKIKKFCERNKWTMES